MEENAGAADTDGHVCAGGGAGDGSEGGTVEAKGFSLLSAGSAEEGLLLATVPGSVCGCGYSDVFDGSRLDMQAQVSYQHWCRSGYCSEYCTFR